MSSTSTTSIGIYYTAMILFINVIHYKINPIKSLKNTQRVELV